MPRNPQEFLQFLADNYHAMEAMCREHGRFASDEDIAAFMRRYDPEDRSPARRIGRMKELRILTCGASEWAPPAFLVAFMEQLHDHHAMATPEVIRGWVQSLDKCVGDVEKRIEPVVAGSAILDRDSVFFLLDQIRGSIHAIVGNVEESCDRISQEVTDFRNLEEAAHIRSRLQRLIMLHDDYLDPVVRIIDIQGDFYAVTDRVLTCCSRLVVLDDNDTGGTGSVARGVRQDVMWMRRQVLQRAHEAKNELGPLCEAAIRESRIAKGIHRAMEAIRAGNWERLELEERLPVVDQKLRRLFSDQGVRTYIRLARQAQKQEPPRLPPVAPAEEPIPWFAEKLIEDLEQERDVDNLLAWVQDRCKGVGPDAAFNLLRRIVAQKTRRRQAKRPLQGLRHRRFDNQRRSMALGRTS